MSLSSLCLDSELVRTHCKVSCCSCYNLFSMSANLLSLHLSNSSIWIWIYSVRKIELFRTSSKTVPLDFYYYFTGSRICPNILSLIHGYLSSNYPSCSLFFLPAFLISSLKFMKIGTISRLCSSTNFPVAFWVLSNFYFYSIFTAAWSCWSYS